LFPVSTYEAHEEVEQEGLKEEEEMGDEIGHHLRQEDLSGGREAVGRPD
jgi:hypothetical protein